MNKIKNFTNKMFRNNLSTRALFNAFLDFLKNVEEIILKL